ncbi:MAG: Fe-S-binding domain-containing protein, partial [Nitrospinaceae bacterium]
FLILAGMFRVDGFFAGIATSGVILAACYMLWMFQRVMFLELKNPKNEKLQDITLREKIIMVPIIVLIFWIGFYPTPFTRTFDASVVHLVTQVKGKSAPKHEEHAAAPAKMVLAQLVNPTASALDRKE